MIVSEGFRYATSISMWMSGNGLPRMGMLDKLADLFDVSTEYKNKAGLLNSKNELEIINPLEFINVH